MKAIFLMTDRRTGYKEYSYDDKGNLTGIVNYKGSGDLLFEEKYILNDNGMPVRSELYDSEGLTSYTLFAYNEDGLIVSEEYYNHKDVYLSGSRYEYDNRGRKILWECLDENKTLVLKSEYVYKGDDLMKVAFLTPLNKEDGSIDYVYDQGQVVKEISINGSGKEERRTEYEYLEDRLGKAKIFQLGRLSRVNEMTYDENENLSRMVTYNRSQKLIGSTEYDYVVYQAEKMVLVK